MLAGFIAQVPNDVFSGLFLHNAPAPIPAIADAVIGPVIAVLSFVCSVGNVPLAAVLWSGGIGFAGVLAFLFADLIVLPIVAIYRKYYGTAFALRITALMYVTMVVGGAARRRGVRAVGTEPQRAAPDRADIFGSVQLNYKLVLNVLGGGGVRGPVVADPAPWRHRPRVRDARRSRQGGDALQRLAHGVLLLGGVRGEVAIRPRSRRRRAPPPCPGERAPRSILGGPVLPRLVLGVDDEHRHLAVVERVVADAAQQRGAERAAPARAHHDEVVLAAADPRHQGLADRLAGEDLRHRDRRGDAVDGGLQRRLGLVGQLVGQRLDARRGHRAARPVGRPGDGGEDREARPLGRGEVDRLAQRPLGVGRAIDADQDVPKHDDTPYGDFEVDWHAKH